MLNKTTQQYLLELDKMQKIIFSFYIKRNFGENRFFHEKKLLQQTSKVMCAMTALREGLQDQKRMAYFAELYQIIFSLDLLKDRLMDHATFEICETELKAISQALSTLLLELSTKETAARKSRLDTAIQALEIVFQNTLQVVAADPMVFLFFIKDLYALGNALSRLAAAD